MDAFRKSLIEKRKQIQNRSDKEKAMAEKLLPFLASAKSFGLYVPVQGEPDLYSFFKEDKRMLLPKVLSKSEMTFYPNENLRPGFMNIPEPQADHSSKPQVPEIMVIPLLAFWNNCRMGYGGGYYDRYLENFKGLKIACAFDEQEVYFEPKPWDASVDVIITPTRILMAKPEKDPEEK